MRKRRYGKITVIGIIAFIFVICPQVIPAQCKAPAGYPSKPLEIIVPWGTGGGADQFSRAIAQPLEKVLGKQIKITCMPGAATITGLTHYMSLPADGYSIFFLTNDTLIGMVGGRTDYRYKDLVYLMRGQYATEMLFAHKQDKRFKSFKDVISYVKAHPEETITCGMAGAGGIDEVMLSIILEQAGIKLKLMPYTNPGERYAALAGRHIDILLEEPGDVRSFITGGIYQPLIAFADKRLEGFEDVITSKELNIDLPMARWRGLAIKAGTPPEIVKYLECATREAFKSKAYQDYQKKVWMHFIDGWMGTDQFSSYAKKEYDIYGEVLQQLGYKVVK
ncbi:MAG: tripartite tricarboxylate transporter substrate binding protein [Deltaproteobacteria bacterium]|nr:tripartite tricarboxylate transporter substrate binding protein [Deltaproteobacteria bacterium]